MFREEKNILPLPGIELKIVQLVASSLYRLQYSGSWNK
jgi:hypothetical protein